METFDIIHYSLLAFGMIALILSTGPPQKLKPYKKLFWGLTNLFFIASFIIRYIYKDSISEAAIVMLLFANFEWVRWMNKN